MNERDGDAGVPEGVEIVEVPRNPYAPNSPLVKRAVIIERPDTQNPYDVSIPEDKS